VLISILINTPTTRLAKKILFIERVFLYNISPYTAPLKKALIVNPIKNPVDGGNKVLPTKFAITKEIPPHIGPAIIEVSAAGTKARVIRIVPKFIEKIRVRSMSSATSKPSNTNFFVDMLIIPPIC
jgi:hypothetical protein